MSDTDSFIDEVNDEVRRERLFGYVKRYGWIAALAVVVIVGGAAFSEYRKAGARAQAEAVGDAMLAALSDPDASARAQALQNVAGHNAQTQAIAGLITASEAVLAGDNALAAAQLDAVAANADVPEIYRTIAAFKSLIAQAETLPADELRTGFDALAVPGAPLRLLAQEQLALLDIAQGNTDAAIDAYQAILVDAEVTSDLQQRSLQLIVSLGGTPDLENMVQAGN